MDKQIKDFKTYTISETGKVMNTITGKEKIPTSNHTGKGYLYVDLYNNGVRERHYIHRLVAKAFIPNPLNKPYINQAEQELAKEQK